MKQLQLRGKTVVYIDWANVYGWTKSPKREIDPAKLFAYLKLYKMLIELRKQVIVVYAAGHLGREIWNIERGLFKAQLRNLMEP